MRPVLDEIPGHPQMDHPPGQRYLENSCSGMRPKQRPVKQSQQIWLPASMGGGQFYEGDGFMPVYECQWVDCGELDQRIGGLDDQTAIGAQCGSLMLRLDEDLFQPYFDNQDKLAKVSAAAEDGEFLEEKRTGGHVDGKSLLLRSAAPRAAFAGAAISAAIFPEG